MLAVAPLVPSMSGANAAISCAAAGPWALTVMANPYRAPPTTTSFGNVWYGSSTASKETIYAFNSATPFNTGNTSNVIVCSGIANLGTSANVSCTQYPNSGSQVSVSLTFAVSLNSACALSGTVSPSGGNTVTIRGGYINGNYGSGIATSTAGDVIQFTLVHQ